MESGTSCRRLCNVKTFSILPATWFCSSRQIKCGSAPDCNLGPRKRSTRRRRSLKIGMVTSATKCFREMGEGSASPPNDMRNRCARPIDLAAACLAHHVVKMSSCWRKRTCTFVVSICKPSTSSAGASGFLAFFNLASCFMRSVCVDCSNSSPCAASRNNDRSTYLWGSVCPPVAAAGHKTRVASGQYNVRYAEQ